MSNKKERRRIVKELLDVTDKEFTDEELIHQLITPSFLRIRIKPTNYLSVSVRRMLLRVLPEVGRLYSAL